MVVQQHEYAEFSVLRGNLAFCVEKFSTLCGRIGGARPAGAAKLSTTAHNVYYVKRGARYDKA